MISNYYQKKVLDHMLRAMAFDPPATVFVSLHTGDPEEFGLNELASDAYERQIVVFNPCSEGRIENSNVLDFDDMPEVTIDHIGLWDAATDGQFLWSGVLLNPDGVRVNPITVEHDGDTVRIAEGRLEVSIE